MRRSKWMALLLFLGVVGLMLGGVGVMLKQVPPFYAQAAAVSDLETAERSSALMTRVQDLQNDIRTKPEWSASFEAGDLNCFLHEMISERPGGLESLLPEGCHSPRIAIENDRILMGFTRGREFWSTVVWVEIRVWLPKNDTNVMAMEIINLKAGAFPLSAQGALESIRDALHDLNVDVTWYRHDGNPVGMFRFYANQLRPATQIHTLKVKDGKVFLAGRTRLENATSRE